MIISTAAAKLIYLESRCQE